LEEPEPARAKLGPRFRDDERPERLAPELDRLGDREIGATRPVRSELERLRPALVHQVPVDHAPVELAEAGHLAGEGLDARAVETRPCRALEEPSGEARCRPALVAASRPLVRVQAGETRRLPS